MKIKIAKIKIRPLSSEIICIVDGKWMSIPWDPLTDGTDLKEVIKRWFEWTEGMPEACKKAMEVAKEWEGKEFEI